MNRRDGIILQKVLSEVNIAAGMMKGCSLTEFLDNEMLKRAVCMTVINVGELVKNLTEECRLSHPEVPKRYACALAARRREPDAPPKGGAREEREFNFLSFIDAFSLLWPFKSVFE